MANQEKLQILKEHLLKTCPEGKFIALGKTFNVLLNSANSAIYLKALETEGFIRKTKETTLIKHDGVRLIYSPAEYEIVSIIEELKVKQINIEEIEEIQELETINIDNCHEENFNGIEMRLYQTNNGHVVPVADIVRALGTSRQQIYQLIQRNIDLFKIYAVNVTLTGQQHINKNLCLTRDGVIGILMKISYNRLQDDKKKLVLEFQKWAIEKLSQLVSTGKVELLEQEHAAVQENIQTTLDMKDIEIDALFNDIEKSISESIHNAVKAAKKYKDEALLKEHKVMDLKAQNERLIAKTVQLSERVSQYKYQ